MGSSAKVGMLEQNVNALPLAPKCTRAQVRDAQLNLEAVALSHPLLGCIEQREAELEEVLRALGICNRQCIIEMKPARVGRSGRVRY